ncbi:transaldolase [Algiphilus sp.]|uniref:transaldolase n=1 Tax=Algiphilus sp. TaxID=1872431 RepID=UPI0025BFB85B|nr:transaldolase [Algiphilus sp.]MCK5771977.1 transaldolase [Algiphilus sp.]
MTAQTSPESAPRNPLAGLSALGQSFWLDYIRRGMLHDGELVRLIADDNLRGMTSNPAIFEKAIAGSHDYDAELRELAARGADRDRAYETLVLRDIGDAADMLRPVFDASGGVDGRVSIEVSPHLARDTAGTLAEARSLWERLARPNIMIKVPGTTEGLPAIAALVREGISVNVTLLFSVARYEQVLEAFITGLEQRRADGAEIGSVHSVASFFLSRIDALVDPRLDRYGTEPARALRGEAAIACARLAYAHYCRQTRGARWQALAAAGAHPQRLLWASTSAKDPSYSDVKYVEPLIGPDTVTTLPPETVTAFRDHGRATRTLTDDPSSAHAVIAELAELDIDLDAVADQLEAEGINKFVQPFDALLAAIDERLAAAR